MRLQLDDNVTLVNVDHAKGVVTRADDKGVQIKWSNGNTVDITHLLADNIVRKL